MIRKTLRAVRDRLVAPVRADLERTKHDLDVVKKIALFSRNVDLVHAASAKDFFFFMFEDDIPCQNTPGHLRGLHRKMSPKQIAHEVAAVAESRNRRLLNEYDPVAAALHGLSQGGKPINLIYVGVNYGPHLFNLADYVRKSGIKCRVLGFDPGVASALLPTNIELNGFKDLIECFEVALSDADGFTIMNETIGISWDNKVVNDGANELRISKVVKTRSLDSLSRECNIAGPSVIVIDTQGGEPEVIAGAAEFIKNNECVLFPEFTPHALWSRLPPLEFLKMLDGMGDVHNVGKVNTVSDCFEPRDKSLGALVEPHMAGDELASFVQRVADNPPRWADLVVIPRTHGGNRVRTALGLS